MAERIGGFGSGKSRWAGAALIGTLAAAASAFGASALAAGPLAGAAATRPPADATFIGKVTPVVPKQSQFAQPGPVLFKISANRRSVIDAQSVDMNGNACGGSDYHPGRGGAFPGSAAIKADGSFSATRNGVSFSGRFAPSGRTATGRFSFHFPGANGAVPCSGRWTFRVHLAPAVPHGRAVARPMAHDWPAPPIRASRSGCRSTVPVAR